MTDAEVIARAKAGLGCLCRHELLDHRGPHCDGPLTSNGAGYCWTCAFIRHCGTWGDTENRTSPAERDDGGRG